MEPFSKLLAICKGNSPVIGEFSRTKAGDEEIWWLFICAWIKGWVNNGEAGDLICHRTHHDVIVMLWIDSMGLVVIFSMNP